MRLRHAGFRVAQQAHHQAMSAEFTPIELHQSRQSLFRLLHLHEPKVEKVIQVIANEPDPNDVAERFNQCGQFLLSAIVRKLVNYEDCSRHPCPLRHV
jgi:hypothetical protein